RQSAPLELQKERLEPVGMFVVDGDWLHDGLGVVCADRGASWPKQKRPDPVGSERVSREENRFYIVLNARTPRCPKTHETTTHATTHAVACAAHRVVGWGGEAILHDREGNDVG